MGKYLVILVVALLATHLLLSRNGKSRNKTGAGRSLHRALESTVRKTAIVVAGLVAALVVILLLKHVTS